MTGMVGWPGFHYVDRRPRGIHPWALVGAPPEDRGWNVGDPSVPPDIDSSALVDAFCTVDAGHIRKPTTRIGARSWLQKRAHIGHNAIVGDDCEICVGVTICGEVTIGDGVKIGGNSWVKPLVRIGDGAVVGGGSVVTKDIPAHEVWAGNPARYMKLAWTHPDYAVNGDVPIGYGSDEMSQRQRAAAKYGYPSEAEIVAGLGYRVDGDFA